MKRQVTMFCFMISLTLLLGCADDEPQLGTVTGKLTVGERKLSGGNIKFQSADGKTILNSDIGYEGNYRLAMIPPGEYKVAIETAFLSKLAQPPSGISAAPPEKGKPREKTGATKEKYVLVNMKYEQFASSNLKATVKAGEQNIDFDCP